MNLLQWLRKPGRGIAQRFEHFIDIWGQSTYSQLLAVIQATRIDNFIVVAELPPEDEYVCRTKLKRREVFYLIICKMLKKSAAESSPATFKGVS